MNIRKLTGPIEEKFEFTESFIDRVNFQVNLRDVLMNIKLKKGESLGIIFRK